MMDDVDGALVEKLWRDLDGQLSRQDISSAVAGIATGFETATVTAFIPIFVYRRALELLRSAPYADSQVAPCTARLDGDG